MERQFYRKLTILALFLMFSQVFYPLGNALASTSVLPPSNLAAQLVTPDDVKLTWSGVYGATGYNIYEITEGQLILRDKTTATSYNFNNLAEGSYRYVVSTLSAEGESGPSAPVSVGIVYPEMVGPTTLSKAVSNGNDITLSWPASTYADQYHIYQLSDDGQKSLIASQTSRSYKITNAPEGSFTYAVTASNSLYGESELSPYVKVDIVYPTMNVPNNFSYTITNGNDVTLKWDTVSYATDYKVYEITTEGKVLRNTVAGTTLKFTNAPAGEYVYEVHSNSDRFGESAEGSRVSVTIGEIVMTAPENFIYELKNINDIYLKWDSVAYATGYNIYEIVNGEKLLKSEKVTGTSITYLKSEAGNHTYVIHSFSDRFGESDEGSRVDLSIDQVTMEAPANFTHEIQNGNDIVLNWETSPNATGYKIYQVVDGQKVYKATVSDTSYTFAKMPAGEYTYEIHSYSSRFGESLKGRQLSVTLVLPVIKAPSNLKETIINETDFTLTWDLAEYADSYRIYQMVDGQKKYVAAVSNSSKGFTSMPSGEYTYIVYSYSSRFGLSDEGSQLTFTLKGKTMLPPENPAYTVTNGNDIKLNWTAAENATGYKVYQVVGSEKVLKKTITGTVTSFLNLPAGDYHFVIHSNSTLFGESNEGSDLKFQLVHPVMEAPVEVNQSVRNGNDLVLSWTEVEYADNYKVYEIVNNEKVLKYEGSALAKVIYKVPAGNHTYIVHSFSNRFGESIAGKQLTVTIQDYTMDPPEITNQTVTNVNTLKLEWAPVGYATKYNIYEIINGEKTLKTTVTGTTATIFNISEGEHYYQVHSFSDRFGESPEGTAVPVDIVFPEIKSPESLNNEIKKGNDVVLSWSATDFATNYMVYELIGEEKILKTTVAGLTTTLVNVSEGNHTYIVHTYSSRFGESPEGNSLVVSVIYPTMEAPDNFSNSVTNGNDVILTWEKADYATNYKVYQIVDNQKVLKSTVTGTSVTYENLPEGNYEYEIHSYSNRFGESPEGKSLTLEMVHPIMQAPENLTHTISNGNDITLNWSGASYATGYKVFQIINGEKVWKKTVFGTSVSFTNMPEEDYEFEVHSFSNRFGESLAASEYSFNLVHPTMQKPENFYQTILNGNDIRLRWSAAEYATGYKIYRITDGQKELVKTLSGLITTFVNMPEGDYQYEIHSFSDRFGESPEGTKLTFNLTWPEVETPVLSGTIFNVNNITLTWPATAWADEYRVYQITDGNRVLVTKGTSRSVKVYNLTEKTHSFEVVSYNTRFGESKPSNLVTETIVYPEMETPKANLILLSDTSARIYWDFVTYANGYNIYEIIDGKPVLVAEKVNNLSYTLTNLSYANHLYYVTSYSNSFGESDPSETVLAKLIIDEEAPVTTLDASADWTNKVVTVNLSATDNETGVDATYYSIDGSDFVKGTTFTVEDEGVHKVSFYSIDKVGNKEEIKSTDVKIDKTQPETSSDLSDNWATADVVVKLSAADQLSSVAKTYYSVDGTEFAEGDTFTVSGDGIHNVKFFSVDHAGNVEDVQSKTVKIDSQTPMTKSNIEDKWYQDVVTVELTATDDLSGVAATYYSLDGLNFTEATEITLEADGIYKVSYYSVDEAGSIEETQTQTVKIDSEAPVTSDNVSDIWYNADVEVVLSAKDNLSTVDKTYYSINGSVFIEGTSFDVSEEGINEVMYYSVDKAGNKEEAKTTQVKIDKSAPTISADLQEEYKLGSDFTISYTAADEHSGVASEEVTINGVAYKNGDTMTLDNPGVYTLNIKVTDHAGWTTTVEKEFVVYIPATLEVLPKVIKGNKGIFTVKANLPAEFARSSFDVPTATLNGVAPKVDNNGLFKQADKGHFKFEREDFDWKPGKVELEFRAYLDNGYLVVGSTIVDVK
ncbi:hypothetical protein DYI25_15250 [Mesobacillus boroniphilus]|uniref:Fibronectin type-III domain-containing protein n=1 Tax=Mesobacillus boroniphilus TaxID=308892 RepID=A0A944CN25_9BACI|nr:hypothetical protein [Mesobacillus boroniphilus]MBS8265782.1 hypothetical protein [Mesobacillus boroniphilus]